MAVMVMATAIGAGGGDGHGSGGWLCGGAATLASAAAAARVG